MNDNRPCLDVILPVHNEAETIEPVIRELLEELIPHLDARLIICEDGSVDGTLPILRRLAASFPIHVITSERRKGYARALIDGFRFAAAADVLVLDADGQCDPRDFPSLWSLRHAADIVIGWRRQRADNLSRRIASRSFAALYRVLFHVPVHDPSCPYALMRRASVAPIIEEMGLLEFGFWWELVARAKLAGLSISEVPVHHRPRAAGRTRVATPWKMPLLAASHLVGLGRLWLNTR